MAVIYIALVVIVFGLLLAAILSTNPPPRCNEKLNSNRTFNICVRSPFHEGPHICADGKKF